MKIKPIAWGSMAACLAGILLFGISIDLIFLGIAIDAVIVIALLIVTLRERKEKFCAQCKAQYDFENDVEYQEISRKLKTYKQNPNSDRRQVEEKLFYNVRFDCTCGKCGTKKTFKKKLCGGVCYDNGDGELLDVEDTIEKWYEQPGLTVNDRKSILVGFAIGAVSVLLSVVMFIVMSMVGPRFHGEKTIDTYDYYGNYYAVTSEYTEYELIISDRRVELVSNPLYTEGGHVTCDDGDQVMYTAEYVEHEYSAQVPAFEYHGALVLQYASDMQYWFYLTDDTEGNAKFKITLASGEILEFTKTPKTVKTVTQDPEDYYGEYKYGNNNSLNLKKSSCGLMLNGSYNSHQYVYADETMLRHFDVKVGTEGIIVFNGSESMYWFIFDGNNLVFHGETTFTKVN